MALDPMMKRLTILGAWCLLAAAFSDPAWAIAHAVHHHEHGEHAAAPAPLTTAQAIKSAMNSATQYALLMSFGWR